MTRVRRVSAELVGKVMAVVGPGSLVAGVIATAGLVVIVFGSTRAGRAGTVAYAVGGYITAAFWFTSSTSVANPAVTIARPFSDSSAGITPASSLAFICAQGIGDLLGHGLVVLLQPTAPHPERASA